MGLAGTFVRGAQRYLPAPFTLAVLLTLFTLLLAGVLTQSTQAKGAVYPLQLIGFWEAGFWNLLEFAMQMMLMLVLGHVLALTQPVDALIQQLVRFCSSTARAAMIVCAATMLVGLFNWGLGLIFGAILARKTGDAALKNDIPFNYPIIGAAGYAGLMVWHGGLSGSAPLKVAEANHFLIAQTGQIPLSQTVFSPMNLAINAAVVILVPLTLGWVASRLSPEPLRELALSPELLEEGNSSDVHWNASPARWLDQCPWVGRGFGLFILAVLFYVAVLRPESFTLGFLTPNFINFSLLGLGILLFGNLCAYADAVEAAISGAAGIMIQFPLYAGIAGIMQHSGLIDLFSDWMIQASTPTTYPLFTMLSAGLVNMFVPSGGGQWAVQGPIVAHAASELGVPMSKCVMALAYGDQLTNMLQPFWALPLLAITRLSAQQIIPYTLLMMLVGGAIYALGLLVF